MKYSNRWHTAQYFEIRWWKRYLKSKSVTDYLAWKKEYWHNLLNILKEDIPSLEGCKILDAGCGPAGIFTILEKNEVTAIDPLLNDYDKDLDHFSFNDYPNIRFITTTIEEFEPDILFDVIFCLNAINHVRDIQGSLSQMANCIAPGGILIMTVDAHKYRPLKSLFKWIPGDILHPHQLNQAGYIRLLKKIGLSIQQTMKLKKGNIFDYSLIIATRSEVNEVEL